MFCGHIQPNSKKDLLKRTFLTFILVVILFSTLCWPSSLAEAKKHSHKKKTKCKSLSSPWTECSKACGVGSSYRVRTKKGCKPRREMSLCITRPCGQDIFDSEMSAGKKSCLPQLKKPRKRSFLLYAGAKSLKKYKMRYCGWCKNIYKCCTPVKAVAKNVLFKRENGKRFIKKVLFTRRCRCHRNCSAKERSLRFAYGLDNNRKSTKHVRPF